MFLQFGFINKRLIIHAENLNRYDQTGYFLMFGSNFICSLDVFTIISFYFD